MNWVQIYTIVMVSLALLITSNKHGQYRDGKWSFWEHLASIGIGLPCYGRIFNWW